MFAVTYKAGAKFQPQPLRDAVHELGVTVVRFHISARGQVQDEDGKSFFVVGKDRFLVVNSPKLPTDSPIGAVGVVDDSTTPYELKIDDYKPLKK